MTTLSKNQVNFYIATEYDDNQRLDNLLAKLLKNAPRSLIFKIIRTGKVQINKKKVNFATKVKLNDIIKIPPITTNQVGTKKNIPKACFNVLFEDDYFLIIDKPSGIACHGGSGIKFGVIEQLRNTQIDSKFLELAHRIDKETSGILVIAKKRQALVKFQELIRNSKLKKIYLTLAIGVVKDQLRNVKAPLYKYITKNDERKVKVDKQLGQFAHTIFNVVTKYHNYTLLSADIKTGRTHQIRVHLQHIGHPIAMDEKYGDFEVNKQLLHMGLKRMFLHAHKIEFIHPISGKIVTIVSELPPELDSFRTNLKTL